MADPPQGEGAAHGCLHGGRVSAVGATQSVSWIVPGIHCAACTRSIEQALRQQADVVDVKTNLAERRVWVAYRDGGDADSLGDAIRAVGFDVVSGDQSPLEGFAAERKAMLSRLGVSGIGMMQVMMFALSSYVASPGELDAAYGALFRWAGLAVATPIVVFSAMPFYANAWRDLRNGHPGMDLPVSIAIASAYVLSLYNTLAGGGEVYFDTVCMFTFFLLAGRYLELLARHRYQADQALITHLLPERATLNTGDEVAVAQLHAGDEIVVLAGELIASDGVITAGSASIDESALTGEAVPVLKTTGSQVFAGTGNTDGELTVRVGTEPNRFVVRELARLYRNSSTYRPAFMSLSDVVARYFVGVVLAVSLLTGVGWWLAGSDRWFVIALTVLVVSCPCALSLATPVAYTIALATLRKLGLLVANGVFLERIARVSQVFLDKTGTLTAGNLSLQEVRVEGGESRERVLAIAKALQRASHHPVSRAFDDIDSSLDVMEPRVIAGRGVEGRIGQAHWFMGQMDGLSTPGPGGLWAALTCDGHLQAWFRFEDRIRDTTSELLADFAAMGKKLCVVTGDTSRSGRAMLDALGPGEVHVGQNPQQKAELVAARQSEGEFVLMVGDGVNDTLAMARADTSIAVRPADISVQDAADAVLLHSDIRIIGDVCRYGTRIRQIIRQNMTWAIAYNLLALPLAMSGVLLPWMAALGMSASSLLVVANSNRLLRTG